MSTKKKSGPLHPSRREFLRLGALASGGILLAACAKNGGSATATPGATLAATLSPTADASTPRRGGVLRFATTAVPDGAFDPALAIGKTLYFSHWVYEALVDIAEDYVTPIPRLAETWQAEDNGLAWVFQLRQGVKWHHGRGFEAQDVVHTFERILDPEFGSPGLAVYEGIQAVEALDENTVRFTLRAANADFPVQLASFQGKIVPHDLTDEQINSEPRGTGPFRIDNYANADVIKFYRNEEYWNPEEPLVDECHYVAIPETSTIANALKAGEVDIYYLVNTQQVEMLSATEGIEVTYGPSLTKHMIFMRLDVAPFDDDRVRRAFKLIGDRTVMTELAWPGIPARPDDDNPVIPTSPYHIETNTWEQDLEQAKALLAEAGYADGMDIKLWTLNDAPGVMEYSLAFADWAKEAGVNIEIEGVPSDRFYADNWLTVNLGTVSWSPRTTVDEQLRVAYTCGAPWNETRFCDEEMDRKLDEALGELDETRRSALYAEIQNTLIEKGGQIIPYHFPEIGAVRSNVHNYKVHPALGIDPRNVWISED